VSKQRFTEFIIIFHICQGNPPPCIYALDPKNAIMWMEQKRFL